MAHVEPIAGDNMRIGLLGGSFNPAHGGHLHISKTALERLLLDRVWWLLSQRNPLKDTGDYAPYEERARLARDVIDTPLIELSMFEKQQKLIYSVDTVRQLLKHHTTTKFVWLLGADSFADLDRWKDWQMIVETIPIAVFNRPDCETHALSSKAARLYSNFRVEESDASFLADKTAPAWCFINQPLDFSASTRIRSQAST